MEKETEKRYKYFIETKGDWYAGKGLCTRDPLAAYDQGTEESAVEYIVARGWMYCEVTQHEFVEFPGLDDRATEKETEERIKALNYSCKLSDLGKKSSERLHDTPQESQTLMKEQEQKEIFKEIWNLCRDYGKHMGFEAVDALMKKYIVSRK